MEREETSQDYIFPCGMNQQLDQTLPCWKANQNSKWILVSYDASVLKTCTDDFQTICDKFTICLK